MLYIQACGRGFGLGIIQSRQNNSGTRTYSSYCKQHTYTKDNIQSCVLTVLQVNIWHIRENKNLPQHLETYLIAISDVYISLNLHCCQELEIGKKTQSLQNKTISIRPPSPVNMLMWLVCERYWLLSMKQEDRISFLISHSPLFSQSFSKLKTDFFAYLWVRSWSNRGQKIQHRKHSARVDNDHIRALYRCRSCLEFRISYVFLRANRRCWNRMICVPAGQKTSHRYNTHLS